MLKGRRKLVGANHGLYQTTEPTPLLRHLLKSIAAIAARDTARRLRRRRRQKRRWRRPNHGRLRDRPARQCPDRAGASRPGRGLPGVRGPSAGFGRNPSPSVPRGLVRPAGADALPDRSQRLSGAVAQAAANLQSARASAVAARTRAGATSRWPNGGRLQAGLHRCACAGAPGRSRGRAEQRGGAQRADQRPLHPRPRPDHRPDRPVGRHRRRIGHREPDRSIGHDHPARPGFVDIQESAADLLALRRALAQGGAMPTTRRCV